MFLITDESRDALREKRKIFHWVVSPIWHGTKYFTDMGYLNLYQQQQPHKISLIKAKIIHNTKILHKIGHEDLCLSILEFVLPGVHRIVCPQKPGHKWMKL